MVNHATSTLTGVDVLTLVVEGGKLVEEDEHIVGCKNAQVPCFAVLSKVDLIQDKTELLPQIQQLHDTGLFQQILPMSALRGRTRGFPPTNLCSAAICPTFVCRRRSY